MEIKIAHGLHFLPQIAHYFRPGKVGIFEDRRAPCVIVGQLMNISKTPEDFDEVFVELSDGTVNKYSVAGCFTIRELNGTVKRYAAVGLPCGFDIYDKLNCGVMIGEIVQITYDGDICESVCVNR